MSSEFVTSVCGNCLPLEWIQFSTQKAHLCHPVGPFCSWVPPFGFLLHSTRGFCFIQRARKCHHSLFPTMKCNIKTKRHWVKGICSHLYPRLSWEVRSLKTECYLTVTSCSHSRPECPLSNSQSAEKLGSQTWCCVGPFTVQHACTSRYGNEAFLETVWVESE